MNEGNFVDISLVVDIKVDNILSRRPVEQRLLPAIERAELPKPVAQLSPTNIGLSAPAETSPSHGTRI